jgi:folate-binding protein YgfZ
MIIAPAQQLQALLESAAVAPLDHLGWLRITGEDRVRWLNGMVTNSIQALAPGEGNYNFVLSAQGRIQGDVTVWMLEDSILLETSANQIPVLTALLDRFIIMDDVELAPVDDLAGLLIAGPHALSIVGALGTANKAAAPCSSEPQPPPPPGILLKQTVYAGSPVSLIRAHSPLVPRFEIWSAPSTIASITDELRNSQIATASELDLEHLRILEGTPLYGTDIRDKELPQETNQTRALHFNKGCYLGQEIVERIRSRGNVHRTFTGLRLEGDLPPAGTPLEVEGKPVGELTSVATVPLPDGPIQLALGYLRREAIERRLPITYPGGTAIPVATPYTSSTN